MNDFFVYNDNLYVPQDKRFQGDSNIIFFHIHFLKCRGKPWRQR